VVAQRGARLDNDVAGAQRGELLDRLALWRDRPNRFLHETIHGGTAIWDISLAAAKHLPELSRRYSSLPMDLADASLVLLAEQTGEGKFLTTDVRDFGAYRFKSQHPFETLLLQDPTTP
jgi:uncharacterized protein